jgi:hypothetical protein
VTSVELRCATAVPFWGRFVFCLLVGAAPLVHGDDRDEARERFFRPSPRFWSFDMELSTAFNSNILENEEELASYGLVAGGVLRGEKRSGSHLFRMSYRFNARSYTATDRWDRLTHDLSVMFFEQLRPRLNAGVIGGYSRRGFTEDRYLANQFNLWSQLEYRPRRWIRLGVHGALRWIRLEDTLRDERVRLMGVEVGGRLGRSSLWELGYRYEDNDAGNVYRRFDGPRFWAGYGMRVGDSDTLEFEFERRRRLYRELMVRVEGEALSRKETVWTPSVSWTHLFGQGRWIEFSYALRKRRSNDPRKNFEAHRFQATLRFPVLGRTPLTGPQRSRPSPLPLPPNGAVPSESSLLDLIRLYSLSEENQRPESHSFTVGSSWKELLGAQGTPTRVSKRPVFNEELWFYGSSSVVVRNGTVVSWHDTGNLRTRTPPERVPAFTTEVKSITLRTRRTSLSEVAAENRRRSRVEPTPPCDREDGSTSVEPARLDENESPAAAVSRLTQPVVVLKDGTRLPGILKRYENGLAYIILFRDGGKTMLTTLPEVLVDKKATPKGSDL